MGKLLTVEQTRRLAMLKSVDREKAVELIAAHLRKAEGWRNNKTRPYSVRFR